MLEKEIVVSNKLGLHARASAKLVQLVQGFKSTVWLISKGREVNAQSIMGVMMLAAGIGTPLMVRVEGADEQRRWMRWWICSTGSSTKEPDVELAMARRTRSLNRRTPQGAPPASSPRARHGARA